MTNPPLKAVTTGPSSSSSQNDPVLAEIKKGYKLFNAAESIIPVNVMPASMAKLYYTNNNVTSTVAGATNNGVHAEMDALDGFYAIICGYNDHAFGSVNLSIEPACTPCCIRCSAVLGLLGVVALPNSEKTPISMGTNQWQLPDSIVKLLSIKTGNKEDLYRQFGLISI